MPRMLHVVVGLGLALDLALAACDDPAINGATWGVTGGAPHSGHLAVGRLRLGTKVCGGTLVGQKTVLSAAHCVDESGGSATFELDDGTSWPVDQIVIHPGYVKSDPPNWDWNRTFADIAVLRLKQAPTVKGIEICTVTPAKGLPVTIIGHGTTECHVLDAGLDGAGDLLSCSDGGGVKRMAQNSVAEVFEHELSIKGAANACIGDSSASVLVTIAGREMLVGLPAHGKLPCGTLSYAMRADAFFAWIDQVAKQDVYADRTLLGDGGAAVYSEAAVGPGDSTIQRSQAEDSLWGGCTMSPGPRPLLWSLLVLLVGLGRRRARRSDRRSVR